MSDRLLRHPVHYPGLRGRIFATDEVGCRACSARSIGLAKTKAYRISAEQAAQEVLVVRVRMVACLPLQPGADRQATCPQLMLPAHRVKSGHGTLHGPAACESSGFQRAVPAAADNFCGDYFQKEERRIGGVASFCEHACPQPPRATDIVRAHGPLCCFTTVTSVTTCIHSYGSQPFRGSDETLGAGFPRTHAKSSRTST